MSLLNMVHKTNFRIDITKERFAPIFQLNAQEVTLPAFEIQGVRFPVNPRNKGMLIGSAIDIEPLRIRVLADEEMLAYRDIYIWMHSLVGNIDRVATPENEFPASLIVNMLDNHKKDIVVSYKFQNAWPFRLGEVEMTYNEQGNTVVAFDVMFYYSYMDIEYNGKNIRPFKIGEIDDAPTQMIKSGGLLSNNKKGFHPLFKDK